MKNGNKVYLVILTVLLTLAAIPVKAQTPQYFQRVDQGNVMVLYEWPCEMRGVDVKEFPWQGAVSYPGSYGKTIKPLLFCFNIKSSGGVVNISTPINGVASLHMAGFENAGPIRELQLASLRREVKRHHEENSKNSIGGNEISDMGDINSWESKKPLYVKVDGEACFKNSGGMLAAPWGNRSVVREQRSNIEAGKGLKITGTYSDGGKSDIFYFRTQSACLKFSSDVKK